MQNLLKKILFFFCNEEFCLLRETSNTLSTTCTLHFKVQPCACQRKKIKKKSHQHYVREYIKLQRGIRLKINVFIKVFFFCRRFALIIFLPFK